MTAQFEKKYNHTNILEEKVVDVFYSKKMNTCVVEVDYEGLKRVTFD